MIRSWTVSYLCPSDGVLQSRELGNQFGGLVLLTYRSVLQISNVGLTRSEAVLHLNLGWEGVAVETEVANPQFGAEIDLNKREF